MVNNEMTMLTTTDNPFDPFEQFDRWYAWDLEAGYDSCSYLARIAFVSSDMTQEEQGAVISDAIDEIVRVNPYGVHKKVVKQSKTEYFSSPVTDSAR